MVTSMDFVDLDKVLDQFEEEEKAAEEILPGRELKPSGYAEFLVTQQDRPWESLSLGQPLESNGKQVHHHSEPVVYDNPYDSIDRTALDSKQRGFPNKHGLVEQPVLQGRPTLSTTLSLDQDLAQAKLKEETIEAYLPPLSLSNGVGQVPVPDLNGWGEGVKGEDGERRGLIASQPASIQTDTLSPASERELLSYPLPKSDILVEGHGPTPGPSQPVQGHTPAPCPPEGMEPNTHYAPSSNSAATVLVSTEQLSQETQDSDQRCGGAEVKGSSASDQPAPGMGKSEETPDADAGDWRGADSDGSEGGPSDTSGVLSSEKPTGTSLQQEMMAAAAREGSEERLAVEAVGFEAGEGDMDRDEVDAYLEELESSVGGEDGDASGQSAVCGPSVGDSAMPDSRHDSIAQDMSTTVAVVHSSDDGEGDAVASAHTGDRSAEDMPEDHQCGDVTQTVGVVGTDDTGGQTVNGDVAPHSAHAEDAAVTSDLSAASFLRDDDSDSHPNVVADVGGGPEAPGRTDLLPEGSAETQEQGAVTKMEGSASNTSFGLSNTGRTEENTGVALNRLMDSTSLQFPVAGNKNGVSSVVKGKLEIEGLLDEIVAARLAQKSSEAMSVSPGQSSMDQTMPREGDGSDKNRTQGWGPEGSMVCSAVREEPRSASPELVSPPDSGTPSPNLGIGARPKDPSHLKKNRPNSLLGLSKISLASPFSPPQQTAAGPVVEVMLPTSQQLSAGDSSSSRTQNPAVGSRQLGVSPPPPEGGAFLPMEGTPAPSVAEDMADEGEESPVLRHPDMRGDGRGMGEGEEASNGAHRPQSWSPSTLSSPPTQRSKRPTSLNLPVRQDRMGSLSPDGDNGRSRKAGVVAESGGSSEAGSSEEESMGVGGTDGCVYEEMSNHDPQQEQEGAGAAAELPMETHPPSILHLNLGKIAPTWLPDADAPACMECAARFTFTKRRHHCRACGKIFCSTCCGQKSRLTYLENKEGRVCVSCHHLLSSAQCVRPAGVSCRSPNPNNPIEYCSTVPPTQQANARAPLPTVMVPTGVLKRHGSNRKSEPKQVMFSDGIRPGGDLTELDGSDQARIPPRRSARAQKKVEKQQGEHSSAKTRRLRGSDGLRNPCLIPDQGLPPVVVHTDDKGEVSLSENTDPAALMAQIKNEEASPVVFAVNLNLFVLVKIMNLDCCLKRVVWCFTTQGMVTVGQEELVIVLETLPEEETLPRDIFCHFSTVYEEAGKGNTVSHMGHSIFNQPFLDSSTHGGFLYLRSTFQCTNKLILPPAPFLFPILLHKWETPWAKVFPIRLLLRLGAEHRYYPCPLVSIRNRKPVFFEIGHTIMNLLADFRNFQYMLQQIRGVSIHMEDQKTFINFPRNRYQDVMKVVSSSNEHVMALGASFSLDADSHLVCIQNEDGNYQTQAINIQNKPRQVTGASFVVFNGALKSSSGLRAKSSIVEDGLMIQILPETMGALKQSLKDMKDFTIPCGSLSLPQPEEVVTVRWVDDDKAVNVGVKSPVDGMSLEGVESVQVHNATDYVGDRYAIRWTQLFFLQTENGTSRWEPVDLSRVAETLANAVCIALTPHLQKLKEAKLTKIGLRVTLQPDSVGYEAGSNGERLPDFYIQDLDNALIPVIHGAITTNQDGPIVLELLLYVIH